MNVSVAAEKITFSNYRINMVAHPVISGLGQEGCLKSEVSVDYHQVLGEPKLHSETLSLTLPFPHR